MEIVSWNSVVRRRTIWIVFIFSLIWNILRTILLRNCFEKLYNERSCEYLLEVKTVLKDVALDERGVERC